MNVAVHIPTSDTTRIAAIDIGTVTCRLLIADVSAEGLYELKRDHAITNLGEEVDRTGTLAPQAIARVEEQIARFVAEVRSYTNKEYPQIPIVAIATSAARDASNAGELKEALRAHGVELSVITGEREAALSFEGASMAFSGENLSVVDVGGGSTEIIAGLAGRTVKMAHSFNIGCRRATERFIHHDPPTQEELCAIKKWCHDEMRSYFAELETFVQPERLVAVAGTATSIAAMDLALEVYDPMRVHQYVVTRDILERLTNRLACLPQQAREQLPGLEPQRAGVIIAGLVILTTILELSGQDCFSVSETDILHGIVHDYAIHQ